MNLIHLGISLGLFQLSQEYFDIFHCKDLTRCISFLGQPSQSPQPG